MLNDIFALGRNLIYQLKTTSLNSLAKIFSIIAQVITLSEMKPPAFVRIYGMILVGGVPTFNNRNHTQQDSIF